MSSQLLFLNSGSLKKQSTILFVGGCYRSGTTLLEKLLHMHSSLCIASQPFPDLFFYCKSKFLKIIGVESRYPLEHLFLEKRYRLDHFYRFLNDYCLTSQDLEQIFEGMQNNSLGLWTRGILDRVSKIHPGTFMDVYRQLINEAASLLNSQDSQITGSKEILCEEFLPFFLQHGHKSIVIIRDPRDMITSLNFNDLNNQTGAHRPVLYSLRLWRKSVAFCLNFENEPGFKWIRYEDLVSNTRDVLDGIVSFLGISAYDFPALSKGILGQNGSMWKGNSSFEDKNGISARSIGRFVNKLPIEVLRYVEACCWPEMQRLGYQRKAIEHFEARAIQDFRDPFKKYHQKFERNYSGKASHVSEEIARIALLTTDQPPSRSILDSWFLFEKTYRELRKSVRVG